MALKTICTERRGALPEAGASIPVGPILLIMTGVLLLAGCQTGGEGEFTMDGFPDPCAIALVPHTGSEALDLDITELQVEIREARRPGSRLERLGCLLRRPERATIQVITAWLNRAHGVWNPSNPTSPQLCCSRGTSCINCIVSAKQRLSPFDYGLLGDVLLEQGDLIEAAGAYQCMVDLKPGLQSYSRPAHVRWLTGDLGGAIDLMRMAASSTSPRDPEAAALDPGTVSLYLATRNQRIDIVLELAERELQSRRDVFTLDTHAWAMKAAGRLQEAHLVMGRALGEGTEDARLFYHTGVGV